MFRRGLVAAVVMLAVCVGTANFAHADDVGKENLKAYRVLLESSMKEKKGLVFYVNGQTIGAAVTKIDDAGYIEARNQTYGRIVIRAERIDAVASN